MRALVGYLRVRFGTRVVAAEVRRVPRVEPHKVGMRACLCLTSSSLELAGNNSSSFAMHHLFTRTFLIGSSLVAVQDEYQYTESDGLVDVTTQVGLEKGLRVPNVFNVNGETVKSSGYLPLAVYLCKTSLI